jgi:hypothetical protein
MGSVTRCLEKATYFFQLLHDLCDQASNSDEVANTKAKRHRHHKYLGLAIWRYLNSGEEIDLGIAEFQTCRPEGVGCLRSGLCYSITCGTTCFQTNTSS